jgi:hypothetical protein
MSYRIRHISTSPSNLSAWSFRRRRIGRAPDHFFESADLFDPSFSHNRQTISDRD